MNETLIGCIALPIALFLCIRYNKWLKYRGSKKLQFIQRAKKKGAFTEGVKVDSDFYSGIRGHERRDVRTDSLVVTYRYMVNGIPYHKKMEFQSPGLLVIKHPEKVTVYYDPANPQKAVCPEEANVTDEKQFRLVKVFLLFIVVMAICVNGLNILLG